MIKDFGPVSAQTSGSASTVDAFLMTGLRAAAYNISVSSGSVFMMTSVNLIHNGTVVSGTEYGTVYCGGASLGAFDSDVSGSYVRLLFTPAYHSCSLRVHRVGFGV
jgi:hypothetical protein